VQCDCDKPSAGGEDFKLGASGGYHPPCGASAVALNGKGETDFRDVVAAVGGGAGKGASEGGPQVVVSSGGRVDAPGTPEKKKDDAPPPVSVAGTSVVSVDPSAGQFQIVAPLSGLTDAAVPEGDRAAIAGSCKTPNPVMAADLAKTFDEDSMARWNVACTSTTGNTIQVNSLPKQVSAASGTTYQFQCATTCTCPNTGDSTVRCADPRTDSGKVKNLTKVSVMDANKADCYCQPNFSEPDGLKTKCGRVGSDKSKQKPPFVPMSCKQIVFTPPTSGDGVPIDKTVASSIGARVKAGQHCYCDISDIDKPLCMKTLATANDPKRMELKCEALSGCGATVSSGDNDVHQVCTKADFGDQKAAADAKHLAVEQATLQNWIDRNKDSVCAKALQDACSRPGMENFTGSSATGGGNGVCLPPSDPNKGDLFEGVKMTKSYKAVGETTVECKEGKFVKITGYPKLVEADKVPPAPRAPAVSIDPIKGDKGLKADKIKADRDQLAADATKDKGTCDTFALKKLPGNIKDACSKDGAGDTVSVPVELTDVAVKENGKVARGYTVTCNYDVPCKDKKPDVSKLKTLKPTSAAASDEPTKILIKTPEGELAQVKAEACTSADDMKKMTANAIKLCKSDGSSFLIDVDSDSSKINRKGATGAKYDYRCGAIGSCAKSGGTYKITFTKAPNLLSDDFTGSK
jgi:hypothetical protein